MKYIIGLVAALALIGCVETPRSIHTIETVLPPTTITVEVPAAPVTLTKIETLVAAENEYRNSLGQTALSKGLTCSLYTVPNGSPSINGATLTGVLSYGMLGEFNQPDGPASDGLNILPPSVRPLYMSWFVVRCSGKIVITSTGYQGFSLTSDDGSRLYIDGSLLINNDNNHGAITLSGSKMMREGVHDFRLEYMQGPSGNQALILNMNGTLLNRSVMYY